MVGPKAEAGGTGTSELPPSNVPGRRWLSAPADLVGGRLDAVLAQRAGVRLTFDRGIVVVALGDYHGIFHVEGEGEPIDRVATRPEMSTAIGARVHEVGVEYWGNSLPFGLLLRFDNGVSLQFAADHGGTVLVPAEWAVSAAQPECLTGPVFDPWQSLSGQLVRGVERSAKGVRLKLQGGEVATISPAGEPISAPPRYAYMAPVPQVRQWEDLAGKVVAGIQLRYGGGGHPAQIVLRVDDEEDLAFARSGELRLGRD